jgi:hypothetical protein
MPRSGIMIERVKEKALLLGKNPRGGFHQVLYRLVVKNKLR